MRNKITDLNNHLFAQLERLEDEEITAEQLKIEMNRSKAIMQISKQILDGSRITLEAMKMLRSDGVDTTKMSSRLLGGLSDSRVEG